jgi:hypothetical protein
LWSFEQDDDFESPVALPAEAPGQPCYPEISYLAGQFDVAANLDAAIRAADTPRATVGD